MNVGVMQDLDVVTAKALIGSLHEAIASVHSAPFPVVAGIQGACLGAGFELALACDLRVAATNAVLGLPEVRVGVPSVIQAALLPGMIGSARAAELLFLGETITATRAMEWGLLNAVVPLEGLRGAQETMVAKILACGPSANRMQKELILRWRATDLASATTYGINAFALSFTDGEPREGMRAFLEKRAPDFTRAERGSGAGA
jgi:enoyl-CoA hydratase/carnithine racemase